MRDAAGRSVGCRRLFEPQSCRRRPNHRGRTREHCADGQGSAAIHPDHAAGGEGVL